MALIGTCTVQDPLHGLIFVHTDVDTGSVEVSGEAVPPVFLRRAEDAEVSPYVPIGTRRGEQLALSVDGTSAAVAPGRGRFTRRSFRVDVTLGAVAYRLTPCDESGSALLRDGRKLGELLLEPETIELMAVWSPDRQVTAQDAALGYALATAFGTGAEHTLVLLINMFGF